MNVAFVHTSVRSVVLLNLLDCLLQHTHTTHAHALQTRIIIYILHELNDVIAPFIWVCVRARFFLLLAYRSSVMMCAFDLYLCVCYLILSTLIWWFIEDWCVTKCLSNWLNSARIYCRSINKHYCSSFIIKLLSASASSSSSFLLSLLRRFLFGKM